MKPAFASKIESFRALIIGFLLVFVVLVGSEFIDSPLYLGIGITLSLLAVWFARKTAHHFHAHHHSAGDSVIDIVPASVLFLANIFHPALDGLSWYETFATQGAWFGVLFGLSIILHEFVRQSALITAFKAMHIKWYWVVVTALIGIASGIGAGRINATFFHDYEYVADLLTLFAYTFIIAEFHYAHREHGNKKVSLLLVIVGIILGGVLAYLTHGH